MKMKMVKIAALLLLVTSAVTTTTAQTKSGEQLNVPLSNPGKPYTLKVHLVQGAIKVTGYDGDQVVINVSARDSDNSDQPEKVNGMKRISSSKGYDVTARELDNTVTVETGNPAKSVNLDLKVPQNVNLKVGTVNDGEIIVDNVNGSVEANNVNDKIELNGISGSVVANTVNGDVTVTFNSVDPKAPMAFSTLNGDINVTFPPSTKANLKMKSDNGDIYSDFDIDIDKTPSKAVTTSEKGLYKITKDDWVYGKMNGGGTEMLLKNMQGDIYVKKAGNK